MTVSKLSRPLITVSIGIGLGVGGTLLYQQTAQTQDEATYARQLEDRLSSKEKELESMNVALGTARSHLERQQTLETQYKAQLTDKDTAFERFRREHDLRIQSMSKDLESLHQRVRQGRTRVTQQPGPSSSSPPVIAYDYSDAQGRFHLSDPNIWVQGDETLDVKQLFMLRGEVFAQAGGSLMTERLQLSEVVAEADGRYTEVAHATLADSHFDYVNPPRPPAPAAKKSNVSVLLTVGPTLSLQAHAPPLRLGGAINFLRWGAFGLAGGLSSDFRAQGSLLQGTGGEVTVTWRPRPSLNVMLGAGVHLPLSAPTHIQPALNAAFILY